MILNFKARTKKKFTLTLEDDRTLVFNPPKKKSMDILASLTEESTMSDIYEIVAKLLSENLAGIKFTAKEVDSMWDLEDVTAFISAYRDFLGEIQDTTKN
jgi:hypothetical protein